jgi:hypothetical protein
VVEWEEWAWMICTSIYPSVFVHLFTHPIKSAYKKKAPSSRLSGAFLALVHVRGLSQLGYILLKDVYVYRLKYFNG